MLCKKIRSNFAILRKLATRTPVSTKRTNRVASKKHSSGSDKKIFLSDLISRVLRGKHTEKSDQNMKKKFLSTCWVKVSRQRTLSYMLCLKVLQDMKNQQVGGKPSRTSRKLMEQQTGRAVSLDMQAFKLSNIKDIGGAKIW